VTNKEALKEIARQETGLLRRIADAGGCLLNVKVVRVGEMTKKEEC